MCALVLTGGLHAIPPNPVARGPLRKQAADLPGESHVPGFPNTPARITWEYQNAFIQAETESPLEARILHAMNHPDMLPAVGMFLPRYASPGLLESARRLARQQAPGVQAAGVSALISQLDEAAATRTHVRGLLRSGHPVVRGRAAEYFCRLGIPPDYPFLTDAMARERDVHALAAMTEAAAAIKHRATVFGDGPVGTPAPSGNPASIYRVLADCVAAHPTAATRRMVTERLRHAEPFEPFNRYNDHLTDPERGDALTRLRRLLAGYPEDPEETAGPNDFPVARTLVPPVRDYFDPKRRSYGILIDPAGGGPFAGRHHVGDDVAWHQDYETVVAIGDGVVRRVGMGERSWGGWVVIEHKDPKGGRFCSLYGHLGALVRVKVGDVVGKGQKIGSVGMSYSQENGGFLAHLHFGIHQSAYLVPDRVGEEFRLPSRESETVNAVVTAVNEFTVEYRLPDGRVRSAGRRPNWTTGYLSQESFNGPHRWVNPQDFIRQYGK